MVAEARILLEDQAFQDRTVALLERWLETGTLMSLGVGGSDELSLEAARAFNLRLKEMKPLVDPESLANKTARIGQLYDTKFDQEDLVQLMPMVRRFIGAILVRVPGLLEALPFGSPGSFEF